MKKLRLFLTVCAALLILALASCGGENSESGDATDNYEQESTLKYYTRNGQKILFGTYPQSEVRDNDL